MQWVMLQQDRPDDFFIAAGQQFSMRELVVVAARVFGIELEFRGERVGEQAVVTGVTGDETLSCLSATLLLRLIRGISGR